MRIQPAFHLFLISALLFTATKSWSQAPELTATGDQIYCPLTNIAIVTDFDLQNPGGSPIDAIYIQISSGYERGTDFLEIPNLPNVTQSFNTSNAKLTLNFSSTITTSEIIKAVEAVTFNSSRANISGEREFSITIGQANYLASTDHYYEYVADNMISWQDAKIAAENRPPYYGLQGYLATLTSLEEAILCGEQSQGAGWIGGTDEEQEGVWKWVTGPEGLAGGIEFWRGGSNGSTTTFAYWNNGEPNNLGGRENYAHIYAPGSGFGIPGSWNDLPGTDSQPRGYIVEYGGMPGDPLLKIATSSRISIPSITATGDIRCGPGIVNLNATSTDGVINWYDAQSGGNLVFQGPNFSPNLNASTTFYVTAEKKNCSAGQRKAVMATILQEVIAPAQITFTNCDEDGTPDGFTDFNLNEVKPYITTNTGLTVSFFSNLADADSNSNPINAVPYNNSNGQIVYARTSSANGCYKITEVNLSVSTTSFPPGYLKKVIECDTDGAVDGFFSFDLTEATPELIAQFPAGQNLRISYFRTEEDALLEQNEILKPEAYVNEIQDQQLVYVRVENNTQGSCFAIGPYLQLTVEPIPVFELGNEENLCVLDPSFTLSTTNAQGNYTYEWTDANDTVISNLPDAVITSPGIYTVTARTTYGCTSVAKQVNVVASEAATLNSENIAVTTLNGENTITIIDPLQLGSGDYEFTLDDAIGPYQDEPKFNNVLPGFRKLYARDKNGCGISSIQVAVLGFANYFTPNNDGYHDIWMPLGLSKTAYTSVEIYIFDRFGKLLKSIYGFDQGWDGSTRGVNMPASDYWYKVSLVDNEGNPSEFTGHMTLKR